MKYPRSYDLQTDWQGSQENAVRNLVAPTLLQPGEVEVALSQLISNPTYPLSSHVH